jgi:hypothetical protein
MLEAGFVKREVAVFSAGFLRAAGALFSAAVALVLVVLVAAGSTAAAFVRLEALA